MEKARISSHAAAVRAAIADGDVCPVCGGVYHGATEHCGDDTSVTEAKATADSAAAEVKRAEDALAEVKRFHAQASDSYSRTDGEVREKKEYIVYIDDKLTATKVAPEIYKALAIALKNARDILFIRLSY